MPRSKFIDTTEVLLVQCEHGSGPYLAETENFPKVYETAQDVARECADDWFVRFFRLSTDMRSAPEEITEDVAQAWCDLHPDFGPDDAAILPTFVLKSEAWEDHCERYEEQAREFRLMRRQRVA